MRDRLVYEVGERSNGGWALQLENVEAWGVSGLDATGIQLLSIPRSGRRNTEEAETVAGKVRLSLGQLAARIRPFALLGGKKVMDLHSTLYGGEFEGEVTVTEQRIRLDLNLEDFDLSQYPLEGESWGAVLTGLMGLKVKARLDNESLEDSTGRIRVSFEDLNLVGFVYSGLDFPATEFSEAGLLLELKKGELLVKNGQFVSDGLRMELSGSIEMAEPLSRSRVKLKLKISLAEGSEWAEMADKPLIRTVARRAMDSEGDYHVQITGTPSRLRFREDRTAAGRGGASTSRSSRTVTPRRMERDEDDEESAARRKSREDRIEERRTRIRDRRDGGSSRSTSSRESEESEEDFGDELEDDEEEDFDEDFVEPPPGPEDLEPLPDLFGGPDGEMEEPPEMVPYGD
jgi:type II secretion system protein N